MKYLYKYLSALLLVAPALAAKCNYQEYPEKCQNCGTTIYLPRPQGLFSAVGMDSAAFWNPWYYKCCDGTFDRCATFNLGFRFDQTWKNEHLAECLYGADECGTINMQGSQATPIAKSNTLIADDYGLSPYMTGSFTLKPRIQNYNIDFAARWELGQWRECLDGLYFGVAATLTNTAWNMGYCNGAFNLNSQPNDLPLCDVGTTKEPAFKDIQSALEMTSGFGLLPAGAERYGKFVFKRAQHLTALANIDMILGYDFLRCDGYHLGLFFKAVAPTGNRPHTETTFAPIVGNGHHWEVGGGLDAHWDIWHCDERCFSLYLTGSATHLFKDKQWRTFDLYGADGVTPCCMSRNMLLKAYNPKNADGKYTFNQLVRASDWTTRHVDSSFDVMGDASIKLMYKTCGWAFGVGYNVYGRSKEKIDALNAPCNSSNLIVAKKGDAGVCYATTTFGETFTDDSMILATSESNYCPSSLTPNYAVDNPVSVSGQGRSTWNNQATVLDTDPVVPMDPTKDIAYVGVPRQIQHTVFGHIDYKWEECKNEPFMGIGGSCSFAQDASCDVCTANQWGVWIHGGLTF